MLNIELCDAMLPGSVEPFRAPLLAALHRLWPEDGYLEQKDELEPAVWPCDPVRRTSLTARGFPCELTLTIREALDVQTLTLHVWMPPGDASTHAEACIFRSLEQVLTCFSVRLPARSCLIEQTQRSHHP